MAAHAPRRASQLITVPGSLSLAAKTSHKARRTSTDGWSRTNRLRPISGSVSLSVSGSISAGDWSVGVCLNNAADFVTGHEEFDVSYFFRPVRQPDVIVDTARDTLEVEASRGAAVDCPTNPVGVRRRAWCVRPTRRRHSRSATRPISMLPPDSRNSSMCGQGDEGLNSLFTRRAGLRDRAAGRYATVEAPRFD